MFLVCDYPPYSVHSFPLFFVITGHCVPYRYQCLFAARQAGSLVRNTPARPVLAPTLAAKTGTWSRGATAAAILLHLHCHDLHTWMALLVLLLRPVKHRVSPVKHQGFRGVLAWASSANGRLRPACRRTGPRPGASGETRPNPPAFSAAGTRSRATPVSGPRSGASWASICRPC